MRTNRAFALALSAVALAFASGCRTAPSPFEGRIRDLSHPFDAETIYWPTEEGFVLEPGFRGRTEGGYYYEAHRFRAAEHGGTHVDAPSHFAEGGIPVDRIPLERLVGPGVVVDVSDACARDRDHAVTRRGARGLRGGARRDPARRDRAAPHRLREPLAGPRALPRHTPAAGRGARRSLHFPGLSAEAARLARGEARRSGPSASTPRASTPDRRGLRGAPGALRRAASPPSRTSRTSTPCRRAISG